MLCLGAGAVSCVAFLQSQTHSTTHAQRHTDSQTHRITQLGEGGPGGVAGLSFPHARRVIQYCNIWMSTWGQGGCALHSSSLAFCVYEYGCRTLSTCGTRRPCFQQTPTSHTSWHSEKHVVHAAVCVAGLLTRPTPLLRGTFHIQRHTHTNTHTTQHGSSEGTHHSLASLAAATEPNGSTGVAPSPSFPSSLSFPSSS